MEFSLLNCFLLQVPVLLWNFAFASKLPQDGFKTDHMVSRAIRIPEHIFRIAVFLMPIVIPMQLNSLKSTIGFLIYSIGIILYFSSWIPLIYGPDSKWSTCLPGIMAPHVLPLIIFFGISLVGNSIIYSIISSLFIFFHTMHGLKSFKYL